MTLATGHRQVHHTANLCVETWAPSREGCVAEAITAMVESFARVPAETPGSPAAFETRAATDEDLLVAVLEEVLYRLDTEGLLPVDTQVETIEGGLRTRLRLVGVQEVVPTGAVPKAVTLHGLRLEQGVQGWSCRVILDV